MSARAEKPAGLSVKQRLALFDGTDVSAEQALCIEDQEVTFTYLCEHGVRPINLLTAAVGPMQLKQRGASLASELRSLGFTALNLCDPVFCNEALCAWGAEAVRGAFLTAPQDGVAVAGTEAMRILDVTTEALLRLCAGFPTEALHVLKQLPPGAGLHGVPASVLLDSGLRVGSLKQCGYTVNALVEQTLASGAELAKLGYTF